MTVKMPSHVLELMGNLCNVFRNRMLFNEAFYARDNIRRITAAEKIDISYDPDNSVLRVRTIGFWTITGNLESIGGGRLLIDFKFGTWPDGTKYAAIHGHIHRDQLSLHYLVVKKLFGHAWMQKRLRPWGNKRCYQKPTDPYGNTRQEYTCYIDNTEEKGRFTFNPAGLLNSFSLWNKEKAGRENLARATATACTVSDQPNSEIGSASETKPRPTAGSPVASFGHTCATLTDCSIDEGAPQQKQYQPGSFSKTDRRGLKRK